jgi:serine/threonine-protein kinase
LFNREVRAAAKLNHPNIVTAYDANQAGDRSFLVMEYVDGPNLSQLVREQGPLPIEQACEYIRQAAVGLDYAHELGLIHRDVKPSNLLVQQTTAGPQIKILDFGLALVTAGPGAAGDSSLGTAQTALGTPDYVSPEQARNQYSVDGRSDLYSLGCTFYYLLTGEPPFPGGNALEKMVKHGSDAPVAVQTKRVDVPDPVAAIVHKLLAKNPVWRHQKAAELAAELASVVGKKADWSAPARPKSKRRSEATVSLAAEEEPSDEIDLDERSASTLPTALMSTRETDTAFPRRERGRRAMGISQLWPWILLAIALAFGLVAGVAVAVRYLFR